MTKKYTDKFFQRLHQVRRGICSFIVLALALPMSPAGLADIIEEVIVTARKRDESLQEVPISITAFNEDMLERINANELLDVFLRTPNFHQNYDGDAKGATPTVRGINSSNTAGADPAVGFYIDEVYMGNTTASSFDLYDLESIEILRGPQGTLFGRNTIGGVVNVKTKKPTDEVEGSAKFLYGNYDHVRINGLLSGPIVEGKLYGKVSALYNDRDGTVNNLNPGHTDLRTQDNWFVRSQLRYVPSAQTEINLTLDYREVDRIGGATQADGQVAFFSGAIPNLAFTFGDPLDRTVNMDCCGNEQLEAWGIALDLSHQFELFEFRSISAYRGHNYNALIDVDLSPNQWVNDGGPEDQTQFSQELRLTSTSDSRFSWIVGLYYFEQDTLDQNFITFEQDLLPILGFPPGTPDLTAQANGDQRTKSYAAYAHLDFDITDKFKLALGGRITHDKKKIDYAQTDQSGFFGGGFAYSDSDSWTEFTGDATLSYNWTDDFMSYASVSRGYKAGGFNDGIGVADNPPFDPEFVWSYELGFKSTWMDGRVILNANGYYLKWKDIQASGFVVQQGGGFRRITGNFGTADSIGAEAELQFLVTENLLFSANFGYQDGEIEENAANGIAAVDSLTGPDYSIGLSTQYSHPLKDMGTLTWYVDGQIQGPNDHVPNFNDMGLNLLGPEQDTFGLLNARVSFAPDNGKWEFALWGKNLTDKAYLGRYFAGGGNPLIPPGATVIGEPRTYGAEIKVNF